MELNLTPEQQALIAQIATKAGIDPEHFVRNAVLRLLETEKQFQGRAPELPVLHLGQMKSLHRRDIYDDVR